MKIVVIGTRGFPNVQGGVEKHCENLYPELAKRGCDITVFAREPYVGKNSFIYKGVKVLPLACSRNKFLEAFGHTFEGIFAAKKEGCDIIHFHAIGPAIFIPLARLLGMKTIMTNHGPDYDRKKWNKLAKFVLKTGEILGSKFSNQIICISEAIAEKIRKRFRRTPFVIPNGVLMPEILNSNEVIEKCGLEKEKYILAVGRFVPEKGFDYLIDAFFKVETDWKLVIVGDSDHADKYSQELRQRVKQTDSYQQPISKNVILTGRLTGKPLAELYSHAGLFVLPSYHEGLPIVLLEALSYGLSCIASDILANKEVGLNDERLFKVGDIEQLTKRIEEFMKKPIERKERQEQINFVSKNYNWSNIADRTIEAYKEIVR